MTISKKRPNLQDRKAAKLLIHDAEIKREQGEPAIAAGMLETAIFLAIGNRDVLLAVEAIGHLVACYLRSYKQTGDKNFFDLGFQTIEMGIGLSLRNKTPGTYLGMLYLRRGDFHLESGEIDSAAADHRKALELVGKRNAARYAEYLGHYGHSLGLMGGGAGREGLRVLTDAENIIRKDKKLREFHRLTVLCGILIRKAQTAYPNNRQDLIGASLREAAAIAAELRDRHGFPNRISDVKTAARELGIRL